MSALVFRRFIGSIVPLSAQLGLRRKKLYVRDRRLRGEAAFSGGFALFSASLRAYWGFAAFAAKGPERCGC